MNTYKLVLLIGIVGTTLSCNPKKNVAQQTDDAIPAQVPESCYLLLEPYPPIVIDGDTQMLMNDSTYLSVNIDSKSANGKFRIIPAERDAAIGEFSGEVDSTGIIRAVYHYWQEGDEYDDFIQILLSGSVARIRFVADMNVSPDSPEAGDWFSLPKVDCWQNRD